MNKYLIIAAAAATVGALAACSGANKDVKDGEPDIHAYVSDKTLNDPLTASASLLGYQAKDQFKGQAYIDSTLNKDEYLRGFEYGLHAQANNSFAMGMEHAQMFYSVIIDLKRQGLEPDIELMYKAYREAFLTDSVGAVDIQAREMEANRLWKVFEDSLKAYNVAKVYCSAESKANIERGAEYIDSLAQQGWTLTPSGIAYRVDSLADGEKVSANDRFYITFNTQSISGQKAHTYRSRPMTLASFDEQPGFAEAVQLAPIGSKVTAVVPGKLAFGTNAPYKVGVNEAIIIELCVDSLYTPRVPSEQ